jgi:hypothetical protein
MDMEAEADTVEEEVQVVIILPLLALLLPAIRIMILILLRGPLLGESCKGSAFVSATSGCGSAPRAEVCESVCMRACA